MSDAITEIPSDTETSFPVCPLISKEGQDGDGCVPIDRFVDHAATGCAKCCLLREIESMYTERTGWFFSESDWKTLRFRNAVAERFAVDIFVPQGYPKLFRELNHRPAIGEIPHEESIRTAKTWLSNCTADHGACQEPASSPLPSRVIEILAENIRLVETNGQSGRYIALSHCWGNSRPLCLTTKATIDDNKQGIAWSSLPKTFQDTVQVCRDLGICYLWIDSICIIQDDEIDWMQESAKMASVYHGSYLTICATSARSDDDGLWPSSLEQAPIKKLIIQRQSHDFTIYTRLKDDLRAVHLEGKFNEKVLPRIDALSPLMSRAWTFQERLISPRLLHFGHGELLWQCPGLQTCECCDNEGSSDSIYMALCEHERSLLRRVMRDEHSNKAAGSWRWFVQDYSGLKLTYEKDALPALSGVAKMCLDKRPGDRYLAGLWERSLIADLAWTPLSPLSNADLRRRPDAFRAPSWSWASIRQQVIFLNVADDVDRVCARVLRATTVLTGIDPTGEVASGSIVLVAPVESARITRIIEESFYVDSPHADHDVMFKSDSITKIDDHTISEGKPVLCLRLQYNAERPGVSRIMLGLVSVDGRPGVYRRLGITRVSRQQDFGDGSFKQEMEVEII